MEGRKVTAMFGDWNINRPVQTPRMSQVILGVVQAPVFVELEIQTAPSF
jgi:hypothetical protein